MPFTIVGEREVELKFDTFPKQVHGVLYERISALTDRLRDRVEAAAPRKTGRLRSEIRSRVFSSETRVAGYVSIYAPGVEGEYAKAATLEYGTNKPRRAFERITSRFGKTRRRVLDRLSKPAHIEAFRYLRGPFEEMASSVQAELQSAVEGVVEE